MKFSENWLREWVDPSMDGDDLTHCLTMLGMEVDSYEPAAPPLEGVVVGQVLEVKPHPNADRLKLCAVQGSGPEPVSVVCGAPNVVEGGLYPLAEVGAELPGGIEIREGEIRGQRSAGMLCSGVELGISEDSEGLLDLDPGAVPGQAIGEHLNFDDFIIDLDLTPNRADCFSVSGVARDLSAATGKPLSSQTCEPVPAEIDREFSVLSEDLSGNPRFLGRVIQGIDPGARTPLWMMERLRRSGIRPIHPVVDVTNYVVLELGQPMHAYDLDRLESNIAVRQSQAGEELVLLDGQSLDLTGDELLITDASGPIGLAGIMGGLSTAVTEGTVDIFLECAWFSPEAIAGRARRFGLHTDASMRFERGVDSAGQVKAIERASRLIVDIAGGQPGPVTETVAADHLPTPAVVKLRHEWLERFLGMAVPRDQVTSILDGLGMQPTEDDEGWSVVSPSWRFDIELEADLVEEVARLIGYEQIPETPGPAATVLGPASETELSVSQVRDLVVQRGYHEVITYSFISNDLDRLFSGDHGQALQLANPISTEQSVMRRSLLPGLALTAGANLKRQHQRLRLFEIGVRFIPDTADYKEVNTLSGILTGDRWPEQWSQSSELVDFFDLKGDLECLLALGGNPLSLGWVSSDNAILWPGRSVALCHGETVVGFAGQLHPSITRQMDLPTETQVFELDLLPICQSYVSAYQQVSRYPSVRRDIAVVVAESVPAADLVSATREAAGPLVRDVVIFDIYSGEKVEAGQKSVALGLILQENSRTLTDQDSEDTLEKVKTCLSRDFKAKIRE